MALSSDEDRLRSLESPDSGIHMSNFDFDIEGCSALLLSGNDPNLNTAEMNEEKSITSDESVIIEKDLIYPVNSENFELISNMGSEEEEEMKEEFDCKEEEDFNCKEEQENIAVDTNTTSARAIEIHSYSVLKVKKPKTLKSRRPTTINKRQLTKTITSQGQKFDIPVKRNKRKLYEFEPLNDPIAERNRLNALNAKKNRDKKKQELMEATAEIERLREERDELRAESESYRDMLDSARMEVEELKRMLKLRGGSRLGNKVSVKS